MTSRCTGGIAGRGEPAKTLLVTAARLLACYGGGTLEGAAGQVAAVPCGPRRTVEADEVGHPLLLQSQDLATPALLRMAVTLCHLDSPASGSRPGPGSHISCNGSHSSNIMRDSSWFIRCSGLQLTGTQRHCECEFVEIHSRAQQTRQDRWDSRLHGNATTSETVSCRLLVCYEIGTVPIRRHCLAQFRAHSLRPAGRQGWETALWR